MAGFGFRETGRLVNQPSINYPLRTTIITCLTVADFGFRTTGRLVSDPSASNSLPLQTITTTTTSLTVAGFTASGQSAGWSTNLQSTTSINYPLRITMYFERPL
ncbi:hypothetical protein N7455_009744 [Penicillium solitum]|uniref:uncharacterized protein n=1 Tax=Penicillium solitum TaxID=60172 RepID=UPI0032C4ACAE|nr:hypothetical protein N7455_009744 [Penicillium solitum]